MNVENFLSEMHGRLSALRFAHDASKATLSPRFNVFNLIDPGVNKLSSLLAFLLNPDADAEHGHDALVPALVGITGGD